MPIITIFVILLVSAFAVAAYFTDPSEAERRARERLMALNRPTAEEVEEGVLREVRFSRISLVDRYLRNNKIALQLQLMLGQAKLSWTVGRFFFYSAVFMVAGGIIGNWWIPVGFVGWIPGMVLGMVPFAWLLYKRAKIISKMNQLLPEAVDLMGRAMRAGYSLPSSFVMVADEVADPLGPEFRRTAEELNYGLPFREALLNLQHRYPLEDLRFLITAVLLQKETGGNLVELLDNIGMLLRARINLRQKVRVYTAQGRMTGVILVAIPFILFVLLNLIHPGYSQPMFESETGRKIIYGALVSMLLGIIFIRRIVNIQV